MPGSRKKGSSKKGSRSRSRSASAKGSRKKSTSRSRSGSRKGSRKGSTGSRGKSGKKVSTWIDFVRQFQKVNKLETYGEAMAAASGPWKKYKAKYDL